MLFPSDEYFQKDISMKKLILAVGVGALLVGTSLFADPGHITKAKSVNVTFFENDGTPGCVSATLNIDKKTALVSGELTGCKVGNIQGSIVGGKNKGIVFAAGPDLNHNTTTFHECYFARMYEKKKVFTARSCDGTQVLTGKYTFEVNDEL